MTIYQYKAHDKETNQKMKGLIDAESEKNAEEILSERNLNITYLKLGSESSELKFIYRFNKVKSKDLVIFFRQFAVMIGANIPIIRSLRILIEQTENLKLKIAISEIADSINNGSRLSEALAEKKEIFSKFYINVIRSGETSGKLDEILTYLADEIEKDYDMNSKIKNAMIYPAFIVAGLFIVGGIMIVFVVPKLTSILTEAGAQLPLATRILIGTSDFFINFWWLIISVIVGSIYAFKMYVKNEEGKQNIDSLKLKVPIFGKLFKYIYIVRFSRSMNTLITGGVTISRSLKIASDIIDNSVYKDLINKTSEAVDEGNPISSVFIKSKEIPKMVSQMMTIGEKTGKLDDILSNVSKFYTREINSIIGNLMTLMEPLVMVVMGVGVGIMIAAIILPMYNLSSQF